MGIYSNYIPSSLDSDPLHVIEHVLDLKKKEGAKKNYLKLSDVYTSNYFIGTVDYKIAIIVLLLLSLMLTVFLIVNKIYISYSLLNNPYVFSVLLFVSVLVIIICISIMYLYKHKENKLQNKYLSLREIYRTDNFYRNCSKYESNIDKILVDLKNSPLAADNLKDVINIFSLAKDIERDLSNDFRRQSLKDLNHLSSLSIRMTKTLNSLLQQQDMLYFFRKHGDKNILSLAHSCNLMICYIMLTKAYQDILSLSKIKTNDIEQQHESLDDPQVIHLEHTNELSNILMIYNYMNSGCNKLLGILYDINLCRAGSSLKSMMYGHYIKNNLSIRSLTFAQVLAALANLDRPSNLMNDISISNLVNDIKNIMNVIQSKVLYTDNNSCIFIDSERDLILNINKYNETATQDTSLLSHEILSHIRNNRALACNVVNAEGEFDEGLSLTMNERLAEVNSLLEILCFNMSSFANFARRE